MMKKWNVGKRLLSIMLASALGIVLCTGCGGSQGGSTQSGPGETAAVESTQTAASPEAASAEQEAAGKEKTAAAKMRQQSEFSAPDTRTFPPRIRGDDTQGYRQVF